MPTRKLSALVIYFCAISGGDRHSLLQELMHLIYGWKELLCILPLWLQKQIAGCKNEGPQELHLRAGQAPILVCAKSRRVLFGNVTQDDLNFCVNTATKYSPWAATTISEGFVTAPGGHRIGICGEAVGQGAQFRGIKNYRSLCIRIAGDMPGIAAELSQLKGSILIIGAPGSGKTTLLRDLVRQISCRENVGVVDQRYELFPSCFDAGPGTDILSGCDKEKGINILLRTMSPDTIAMDEITKESDCEALIRAAWCAVRLIATAHAANEEELNRRIVYRPLVDAGIFDHLIILRRDKTYLAERMKR